MATTAPQQDQQAEQPGFGFLYPNRNRKADNHPHLTGTILAPDGTPLQMAAWLKVSKRGVKYYRVKLSEPQDSGIIDPAAEPEPEAEQETAVIEGAPEADKPF